jgi:anti-anti-sigma factor
MTQPTFHHIQRHTDRGVLVLTLNDAEVRGDELAAALRDELLAAVGDAASVVLDMRYVTYLSSVAFRPLLALYQQLKDRGGRIVLCNLSRSVAEVMHLMRLTSTSHSSGSPFEEKPDLDAALTALAAPAP